MRRNVNLLRLFGNVYIIVILLFIVFTYYLFVIRDVLMNPNKTTLTVFHIIFIHIGIGLMLVCFFKTIVSDPGKVPLFWGFFLDDPDHKRKRYCLICHIFKPERSHHCSACNRCVLNMDHHCPWLNNCVGFYNRKYFLLLLFYSILTLAEMCLYYLPMWIKDIIFIYEHKGKVPVDPYYLTVICYLMNCGMLIVISMFFKFHCELVLQNLTTIEHMDRRRGAERTAESVNYDMGVYYNFIQIFGKNPWLWFIPVTARSGKPVGDGVVWPQKPANAQRYEIDMSIRNVTAQRDSASQNRASPMRADTLNHENGTQEDRPANATPGQMQTFEPVAPQRNFYNPPNNTGLAQSAPPGQLNPLVAGQYGAGRRVDGNTPNENQSTERTRGALVSQNNSRPFNLQGGPFAAQRFDPKQQAPLAESYPSHRSINQQDNRY